MSAEIKEKQPAALVPGEHGGKTTQQQLIERREAVEANRREREKPREDYLKTGKGKASDHFEVTTNRETVERFSNQDGAPKTFEDFTESEREKFLRDGELIPAKPEAKAAEKKAGGPARPKLTDFVKDGAVDNDGYEKALDRYETDKSAFEKAQGGRKAEPEFDPQLDRELYEEVGKRRDWWAEEGHAEAHKTLQTRTVQSLQALSQGEKNIIANSPVRAIQLNPEFDSFLGHAMARVKNLGRIHLELAVSPELVKQMNQDWIKSADNPKMRWSTERAIRYMLHSWDKKAGSASGGSNGGDRKTERKLTQASGFREAAGGSSAPADDGSAEAAWKRKDLSQEERGETYRQRKNEEEAAARRKKYGRR
jgi:hypothetical protein